MSQPTVDIERIVREVVHRLAEGDVAPRPTNGDGPARLDKPAVAPGGSGKARLDKPAVAPGGNGKALIDKPTGVSGQNGLGATSGSSSSANGSAAKPQPCPKTKELKIADRVVTMASLSGGFDGVRRVVVGPAAIVTPAVRDELERRRIALHVGPVDEAPDPSTTKLLLAACETGFDPAAVARTAADARCCVEQLPPGELAATVGQLTQRVGDEQRIGVLLTATPAAAVCLANRHRGVRAVEVRDGQDVTAALTAVGCNLLVVDASRCGLAQTQNMVRQFASAGRRECPLPLRPALDEA